MSSSFSFGNILSSSSFSFCRSIGLDLPRLVGRFGCSPATLGTPAFALGTVCSSGINGSFGVISDWF